MKWIGFVFITMLLLVSSIVVAQDSATAVPTLTTSDDSTDYVGRSMDVRYENLVCKIDFTVGQIDVINKYTTTASDVEIIDRLLNDKDMLSEDKDKLKTVYDEDNLTVFNNFIIEILHPDFNKTNSDLKEFKDNYKTYIPESDRDAFKTALTQLRTDYADCTNNKYMEMSKLMDQYYKHRSGMWDQIIKSMTQRGLNTTEMNQTREQLQTRLHELEQAMNSGNQTQIREQLQDMKNEQLQLWSRFHSGRLNSYLNRIEPAANKYGRSADVDKIKAQLGQLKNFSEDKDEREEARQMWSTMRDSANEMREMSKDMLKQRTEDRTNAPSPGSAGRR